MLAHSGPIGASHGSLPRSGVVSEPRKNIASALYHEAKRRRVFPVMGAYGAVSFGLIAVADAVFPALLLPDVAFRILVVLLLFGFPVGLVLAWAFDLTPPHVVRTPDSDLVAPADSSPHSRSAGGRSPASRSGPAGARKGWRWPGRQSPLLADHPDDGPRLTSSHPGTGFWGGICGGNEA